jgi:hypothetical protein
MYTYFRRYIMFGPQFGSFIDLTLQADARLQITNYNYNYNYKPVKYLQIGSLKVVYMCLCKSSWSTISNPESCFLLLCRGRKR